MTDNLPANEPAPEPNPYNDWKAREKLTEKAIALNKANILEALKLAGVEEVVIEFNGSGDDGGIENVTCDGDYDNIPDAIVNEWRPDDNNTLIGKEGVKLRTAIENFAYDLLAHTRSGWENNAGAFGEIKIDVETGTATHTHNDRFEDYHTSTYNY